MDYIHTLRELTGPGKLILNCAGAIIVRDHTILMQRRADNGRWGLIGGLLELNETYEEAAIREVREETGLEVRLDAFLGIFHNHQMVWSNGDEAHVISAFYTASIVSGEPRIDEESLELCFFDMNNLPALFAQDHVAALEAYFSGARYPLLKENPYGRAEAPLTHHLRFGVILSKDKRQRFIIALQGTQEYPLVFLREMVETGDGVWDLYALYRKELTRAQAQEILDRLKAKNTRGAKKLLKNYFEEKQDDREGVGPVVLDDMIPDAWYDAWKEMEGIITSTRDIVGYWEILVEAPEIY